MVKKDKPPFDEKHIEDLLIAAAVENAKKNGEKNKELEQALEKIDDQTASKLGVLISKHI